MQTAEIAGLRIPDRRASVSNGRPCRICSDPWPDRGLTGCLSLNTIGLSRWAADELVSDHVLSAAA